MPGFYNTVRLFLPRIYKFNFKKLGHQLNREIKTSVKMLVLLLLIYSATLKKLKIVLFEINSREEDSVISTTQVFEITRVAREIRLQF